MKSDVEATGFSDGRTAHVADPIRPWFEAAEDLGDHIGIRFGRIPPGSGSAALSSENDASFEPEWIYKSHADFDGIGGFVDILRKRGVVVNELKTIPHSREPSWGPFLRSLPQYLQPRQRVIWRKPLPMQRPSCSDKAPETAVWHVFDEDFSTRMRAYCRKGSYTVNSFLLKHLSIAIFPDISDKTPFIPWMVPVNLRGKASRSSELENHSSFVRVIVRKQDSAADVHRKIYDQLERGGHWASWRSYEGMQFLPNAAKRFLIKSDLVTSQWVIGAFSNIGEWDKEKSFSSNSVEGDWLFCPPAISFFKISSGCMTFRGRLSLCMHLHPALSCDRSLSQSWMSAWVRSIEAEIMHEE